MLSCKIVVLDFWEEGRRRTGNPQAPLLGRERVSRKDARRKRKRERVKNGVFVCSLRALSLFLRLLCVAQRRKKEKKEVH